MAGDKAPDASTVHAVQTDGWSAAARSPEKPALHDVHDGRHDAEDGRSGTGLDRALKGRHLQFIAIGGTIGTGLFLGIGGALARAGPVSLLLAFVFVGGVVYSVMTALGEMAAYMPVTGAFTVYASRFVDPSLGFSMGFIYLISWVVTFALELTAAGLIIQYWNESLNIGIWIAVFWVVFTAANFLPIRLFGELEMWFSSIKVVTIVGFIIFAICVNAGVGDQGYIGFKYWVTPGAHAEYLVSGATGKFVGFWAVLITAGFSFQGTELVGIGAGETENPRKEIPSAIRWTYWGIFVLFIATVFMVGIVVPSDNDGLRSTSKNASASPLVIAANLAGVQVLPHIINAVLLTAVLTAANSDVYSSSRILIALADEGHAPSFLKATNRHGTPYLSVAVCASFGLLGFLNLSKDGETVFSWLLSITAVAGFIVWSLITQSLLNLGPRALLEFVRATADGHAAVICGDFNAEPSEPVYALLSQSLLNLGSAYAVDGAEPAYTSWKVREEGEQCQTLDYIFYTKNQLQVDAVLELPADRDIGECRLPSLNYPSDHLSLVCDLSFK